MLLHDDLFVLSDLHLSDPVGTPNLENFRADQDLARFVDHEIPRLAQGRSSSLVLNGDFIDFIRAIPRYDDRATPPHVGATESESRTKLAAVMKGHPEAFEALSRHIGVGNQLVILPGNHDLDLCWDGVWADLAARLGGATPPQFARWMEPFLRERGVHIEHGHQRSFDNRADHWPPFVLYEGKRRLERPWGTFFMEYAYNLAEDLAPWINKVHPASAAVWLAIKHRGWDKIPAPLVAIFVEFFLAHGKQMALRHMMGRGVDERLSVEELETALGQSLPEPLRSQQTAKQRPSHPPSRSPIRTPGRADLLGMSDQSGIDKMVKEVGARSDVNVVLVGHTHRARESAIANHPQKKLINTGTWTGHIDVDTLADTEFTTLCEAAKSPSVRLTYAHVHAEGREAALRLL